MRRGASVIFSLILVLAVCFIAGCSSLPSGTSPADSSAGGANASVRLVNMSEEIPTSYSFEDVKPYAYNVPLDPNAPPDYNETHVLLVTGENMDENANASRWLFVMQFHNYTAFVTFDQKGETVTNWPAGYTGPDTYPDQVIPPKELFAKNRDLIFRPGTAITNESIKLALSGGNYTLTTMEGKKTRIQVFDATTGALTLSNER